MLSPSSIVISLLFTAVSCIANSTLGLQADDPSSSSLASESYERANFPLANIEDDGANLEILNSNVQLQQLGNSPKALMVCSRHIATWIPTVLIENYDLDVRVPHVVGTINQGAILDRWRRST